MEIDFHFGVTYVVGRLAGLDHAKAQIVATSSQYVDDTVNQGVLRFKTGPAYYRLLTAHSLGDHKILRFNDQRAVWVPFHFLPGNDPVGGHEDEFYNKIVCRPKSEVAKAMVCSCILKHDRAFALHQLGITAHVFLDTFAHQGFAGIKHRVNLATNIHLEDPEKDVKWTGFRELFRPRLCGALDFFFPMGHGTVLHYPDHPFRRWSYVDGHGQQVSRDNPTVFLEATQELYKVIRRFVLGDPEAEVGSLPEADEVVIEGKIRSLKNDDGKVRNRHWLQSIREGEFSFGTANPEYRGSGPGSWKYKAIGLKRANVHWWERFRYHPEFVTSDWKLFHDAAQAHQVEILREILPRFGICAI
jgi:hypothetical protein